MTHPPRRSPIASPEIPVAAVHPLSAGLLGIGVAATLLVALLALNAMRDPAFVPLTTPAAPATQASVEV